MNGTEEHRTRRGRGIVLPVSALTAGLLGVLGWAALSTIDAIDTRYVHQTLYERTRLADSLVGLADRRELAARLARIDSSLTEIRALLRKRSP